MIALTPPPPGFMRMAGGQMVPISRSGSATQQKTKRFLLAISFYEGDRETAEDLMTLIADLERTRNRETDVLLVRRGDCRELSSSVVAKLQLKFERVLTHACRRSDAKSYPHGPNQMFCDLVYLVGTEYRNDYFAFLNMEADAVPTRPGWLGELSAAWQFSQDRGKGAIGYIHNNPRTHLNGLAVYASDMVYRVGGNRLMGCDPQICYDIAFANMVLPHAADTPLIYFSYRKATITAAELFAPQKEGIAPALYHGVKDGSAREAVKARYITFTDKPDDPSIVVRNGKITRLPQAMIASAIGMAAQQAPDMKVESLEVGAVVVHQGSDLLRASEIEAPLDFSANVAERSNVYTYVSGVGRPSNESVAIIEAWRKGWTSRGWNPVVLTIRDAAGHAKFDEFALAIDKLPYIREAKRKHAQFYRWLALDIKGGGLLVDNNVLPSDFTPSKIAADGGLIVLMPEDIFLGAWLNPAHSKQWIEQILAYDAQPEDLLEGKPHVSDATIVRRAPMFGNAIDIHPPLVVFSSTGGQERVSVAMEKFLGGVTV